MRKEAIRVVAACFVLALTAFAQAPLEDSAGSRKPIAAGERPIPTWSAMPPPPAQLWARGRTR